MAAKTEDTARIVVESKQTVPVFPPIRIGACGSDNYQTVEIVADDRERPSGMVAELEKAGQAIVKIERLSVGDYCVDGAVLIERKTAVDFAQSLILKTGMERVETVQATQHQTNPIAPRWTFRVISFH